jgi:LPS O-antigen subunit length determinant protein (WzzB/FepE family)
MVTADSALQAVSLEKQKEMQAFDSLMNDGFLTRIEALKHLLQNNSAAQFRYYLLIIILVLIELMPVIAKSLLPEGTYDEKVQLREAMERQVTATNIEQEGRLKMWYNRLAHEQDSAFIQSFFDEAENERRKKMMARFQQWNESEDSSFDALWENIKRDVLSKQEG